MRYSVFNSNGKWQASYSHKIPNVSIKTIKSWARQTGKLVGGKVYEKIVPSDKKYKSRDVLLYDFTHLTNKLEPYAKKKYEDSNKVKDNNNYKEDKQ
jgi:hypothetical protein